MFYSDSEDLDEESEDEEQFFYTSLPDLTYQPSEASCLISVNQNIDSLVPLIGAGIMQRPTAENIAGSGLNLHHLRVIARRDTGDGSDNLRAAFTMLNSERKPRVTNHKKTLEEVIPKIIKYFEGA